MKNIMIFILLSILMVSSPFYSEADEKVVKKENIKKQDAQREVINALYSIGLVMPSFGNDPCQGMEKTMGGMKKYGSGGISLGGIPKKPSTNIGKQGQIMEEESFSAENVCYESYDSTGKKCAESTSNPDGTVTFKNDSEKCVIVMGEDYTIILSRKTEVTMNIERKDSHPILEILGKARSWIMDKMPAWPKPSPVKTKGGAGGVRGNCDPEGIAGGCIVKSGDGVVMKTLPEYLNAIAEEEKKGTVERLKWSRINPSPDSSAQFGGPVASKTYPGEATKSGYEREKSAKTEKGETIINPSDSSSQRGERKIDFCGRGLPSPEEAASMGFDPGRITDPVKREWTGKIEQQKTTRTLTWTKTIHSNATTTRISHSYRDGELVGIMYEFFDKRGNKIGYAIYDGKTGSLEAKRLTK